MVAKLFSHMLIQNLLNKYVSRVSAMVKLILHNNDETVTSITKRRAGKGFSNMIRNYVFHDAIFQKALNLVKLIIIYFW